MFETITAEPAEQLFLGADMSPTATESRVQRFVCRDGSPVAAQLASMEPSVRPLLIDVRDLREVPGRAEVLEITDALVSVQTKGRRRVAILARAGALFGVVRMVCTLADMRGALVGAFTDEGSALEWLGEDSWRSEPA